MSSTNTDKQLPTGKISSRGVQEDEVLFIYKVLWKYFLYHLREGFIKRANDGRQRSLKPRVVYSNQIPTIGRVETPQLQKEL
jgi:hypothetical protein